MEVHFIMPQYRFNVQKAASDVSMRETSGTDTVTFSSKRRGGGDTGKVQKGGRGGERRTDQVDRLNKEVGSQGGSTRALTREEEIEAA